MFWWKKHRDTFPHCHAWRSKKARDFIHSNFCSVEVASCGGSKYFTTLIYDFIKKIGLLFEI